MHIELRKACNRCILRGITFLLLVILLLGIRWMFPTAIQSVLLAKFLSRSTIKTTMKLTSLAFSNNGNVPSKYTCDGQNVNPPLSFEDIPANAKSLVLIVDDPDAPMGTWDHWIIFNIPPTVADISENSVPAGTQALISWGKPGYGGPCPPSGTHHYHFKLYALDAMIMLGSSAKKADIEQAMQGHILEQTELLGLYSR